MKKITTRVSHPGQSERERIRIQFKSLLQTAKELLKRGSFGEQLETTVAEITDLLKTKQSILQADTYLCLKGRCIASEVHDYYGRIDESRRVLEGGERILDSIPATLDNLTETERKEIREKIRFALDHAQAYYYRGCDYSEARDRFKECLKRIEALADEDAFPCLGTQAQALFFLGRVYTQLNEFNAAEDCFLKSIEFHYKRAQRRKVLIELEFASYKAAICSGLGLGWINYSRGFLRRARHNILPARSWLALTADELNKAYLELILGSASRALAPRNSKELGAAIEHLEHARQEFTRIGHQPYLARAAYELSLAHLYNNDLPKAREHQQKVQEVAVTTRDVKWLCNSMILYSRIYNASEQYQHADTTAGVACYLAEQHKLIVCHIMALIARSQANLKMNNLMEARQDAARALELNQESRAPLSTEPSNPRVEASCHLCIAYSYALERKEREARKHLEEAKRIAKDVEHSRISELIHQVEKEIDDLCVDLVIPANGDLNYDAWIERVRRFLLERAQNKEGVMGKKDIARVLGVSRPTLDDWLGGKKRRKKNNQEEEK